MIAQKQKEEERELKTRIRARDIPNSVKKNKYTQMLREQDIKREDMKKLSIAKTKANEAPFNFYERDM